MSMDKLHGAPPSQEQDRSAAGRIPSVVETDVRASRTSPDTSKRCAVQNPGQSLPTDSRHYVINDCDASCMDRPYPIFMAAMCAAGMESLLKVGGGLFSFVVVACKVMMT